MKKRNTKIWLPSQHGAWFMLLLPAVIGWFYRLGRPGSTPTLDLDRLILIVAWIAAYCFFNALSLALKGSKSRRLSYVAPITTYFLITVVAALICVAIFGWVIGAWGLIYIPLCAVTLVLTYLRRDRSLLSGAATIAAASIFSCVVFSPNPFVFVRAWNTHDVITLRWLALMCFLYFFGTVFVVKTMIRKRGDKAWFAFSIMYHLVAIAIISIAVAGAVLSAVFIVFFIALLARAIALPLLGPLRHPPRIIKPVVLGLMEVVFSFTLVGLTLALVVF
ncbi:MAG: YwiC-like family protein [Propionibacteriaceae bacterium]